MEYGNNNNEPHSLENVWTSIRHTQNEVAGMGAKLDAVIDGVEKLSGTVNAILTRPHKETNWIGIGSLIVAVVLMAGTYIQARLSPTESRVVGLKNMAIDSLKNDSYQNGKLDALQVVTDHMFTDLHNRMLTVEERSAKSNAEITNLKGWMEQVDLYGSRKHVMSAPEAFKSREQ